MISVSPVRLADAGPVLKLVFFSTLLLSSANAQTFTVLHAFTGSPDGASSYAPLLLARGVLYGTTEQGGDQTCNCGTVFKIDTNGAETVLHSFAGWPSDGGYPVAGLMISHSGEFYGTASEGGNGNAGAVFRMDANGVENLIYSFSGDGSGGASPISGLVQDPAGNIYGTTNRGGLYGAGNVYEISNGRNETPFYNFTGGTDGGDPAYGRLVLDAAGNLYGTATQGGTKTDGVVFAVNSAGALTVLRNFGPSGLGPYSGLVADSIGNLYGVTTYGGIQNCYLGCGTVFKLGPDGTARGIYQFTGGADGANPIATPLILGGDLYGTTFSGGAYGFGTVFKLDSKGNETVLHSFDGLSDGQYPHAGLVRDANGSLYGTTTAGGSSGLGTVFMLIP